jgi:hypothetical protein
MTRPRTARRNAMMREWSRGTSHCCSHAGHSWIRSPSTLGESMDGSAPLPPSAKHSKTGKHLRRHLHPLYERDTGARHPVHRCCWRVPAFTAGCPRNGRCRMLRLRRFRFDRRRRCAVPNGPTRHASSTQPQRGLRVPTRAREPVWRIASDRPRPPRRGRTGMRALPTGTFRPIRTPTRREVLAGCGSAAAGGRRR